MGIISDSVGVLDDKSFQRLNRSNTQLEGRIRNALDGKVRVPEQTSHFVRVMLTQDLNYGMFAQGYAMAWNPYDLKWVRGNNDPILVYGMTANTTAAGGWVMVVRTMGDVYVSITDMLVGESSVRLQPFSVYEVDLDKESGPVVALKVVGPQPWIDPDRWTGKDFFFTGPELLESPFMAGITNEMPVWVRYHGTTPTPGSLVGPVQGRTSVQMFPTFTVERHDDVEMVTTTSGVIPFEEGEDPNPYDLVGAYSISDDRVVYAFPKEDTDALAPPGSPVDAATPGGPLGGQPLGGEREWDFIDPETGYAIFERIWRYVKKTRNIPYEETMTYGWRVISVDQLNQMCLIADRRSLPNSPINSIYVF